MRRAFRLVAVGALLLLPSLAKAAGAKPFEPGVDVTGSLRLRYEDQEGFDAKAPGAGKDDSFLLYRARLEVDW